MNQRIILSILNYDGHSFIDWLNKTMGESLKSLIETLKKKYKKL